MPKKVYENGFVISWGRRTKKELDEFWASGAGGPPISSPSLSLSPRRRCAPRNARTHAGRATPDSRAFWSPINPSVAPSRT